MERSARVDGRGARKLIYLRPSWPGNVSQLRNLVERCYCHVPASAHEPHTCRPKSFEACGEESRQQARTPRWHERADATSARIYLRKGAGKSLEHDPDPHPADLRWASNAVNYTVKLNGNPGHRAPE